MARSRPWLARAVAAAAFAGAVASAAVCRSTSNTTLAGGCLAAAPVLLQTGQQSSSNRKVLAAESPRRSHFFEGGHYCERSQADKKQKLYERDEFATELCEELAGAAGKPGASSSAAAQPMRTSRRKANIVDRSALLKRLSDKYGTSEAEGVKAFMSLSEFEAEDIFAFRETWTNEDTRILRLLDSRSASFVDGALSTENVVQRLPSLSSLDALIERRSLAVVGSGASLEGLGLAREIEEHPEVARFNDFPRDDSDLGRRTTLHVVNRWVRPAANATVVDLEISNNLDSYCSRFNRKGQFFSASSTPWMVRPSVSCALSWRCKSFTRGFLFYWLVGTLFEEVDMYGFTGGKDHIQRGQLGAKLKVQEIFLDFEHRIYQEIRDLQIDKRVLAL